MFPERNGDGATVLRQVGVVGTPGESGSRRGQEAARTEW